MRKGKKKRRRGVLREVSCEHCAVTGLRIGRDTELVVREFDGFTFTWVDGERVAVNDFERCNVAVRCANAEHHATISLELKDAVGIVRLGNVPVTQ